VLLASRWSTVVCERCSRLKPRVGFRGTEHASNRVRASSKRVSQCALFVLAQTGGVEEGGVPPVVVRWGTVISDGDVLAVLIVFVVVVF